MAFVFVYIILFLLTWNFRSELISPYLFWANLPILCPGGHFLFEGRQHSHRGLCKGLSSMNWGTGSSLNHKSYRYQVSYNLVPKKELKSFKFLCYFKPKNYVDALAKLQKKKNQPKSHNPKIICKIWILIYNSVYVLLGIYNFPSTTLLVFIDRSTAQRWTFHIFLGYLGFTIPSPIHVD